MADQYIGKTNKELIIEVIGKVNNIEKSLKECRPICFKNEHRLIKLESQNNKPNFSLTSFLITSLVWLLKKLKGGEVLWKAQTKAGLDSSLARI